MVQEHSIFTDKVLSQFCTQKTIALFCDGEGVPIRAINRGTHQFSALLEWMMTTSLYESFNIPKGRRLSDLVAEAPPHPRLSSRNTFESKADFGWLHTQQSLTEIEFYQVNDHLFLGLIHITEFALSLSNFGATPFVLTSEEGNVIAYNRQLESFLVGSGMSSPLGHSFEQFFRLSPVRLLPSINRRRKKVWSFQWEWTAGTPAEPFFDCHHPWVPKLVVKKEALRLDNGASHTYAYLPTNQKVDIEANDFNCTVGFLRSSADGFALMFRAKPLLKEEHPAQIFPDGPGYNIGITLYQNERRLVFKRDTIPVSASKRVDELLKEENVLSVEKKANVFRVILNEQELCLWDEDRALVPEGRNSVILAVRPGKQVDITSIRLESSSLSAERSRANGRRRVVSFRQKQLDRHFIIHDTPFSVNAGLWTLHSFEEVTSLFNGVNALKKKEKKQETLSTELGIFFPGSQEAFESIAENDLGLVIEGETGTGKSSLARALHKAGPRAEFPFVQLDVSAIPEQLLEDELFGHEVGAFTGAVRSRAGRFEAAGKGILLIKGIDTFSLKGQAKLLSVLEERQVTRLGGVRSIPVHARVFVTSLVPLKTLLQTGQLREDLYYRLISQLLVLPPLRQRLSVMPEMAQFFMSEANGLYGCSVEALLPEYLAELAKHSWPGNLRELRQVVHKSVIFAEGFLLSAKDFKNEGSTVLEPSHKRKPYKKRVYGRTVSVETLQTALRESEGVIRKAAARLNISRPLFYNLMKQHAISH